MTPPCCPRCPTFSPAPPAARPLATWDVLKLESRRTGFKLALQQLTPTHALCVNLFRSTGSAGYVLSRHAAQVYLDKLLPIGQPFDHAFDRGWFLGLRMREVAPLVVSGQMSANAEPARPSPMRRSSS